MGDAEPNEQNSPLNLNRKRIHGSTAKATAGSLKLVRALSLAAVCLSCVTLLGWFLHLPLLTSIFPHYASMKPNTAFCLGLLGVSSLLSSTAGNRVASWQRWVATALQGIALVLSSLSLLEYALHASFGIDEWLLRVPPDSFLDPAGRMSAGTALSLTVTCAAYLLLDRLPKVSVWLLLSGILMAVSGLGGFAFNAGPLISVPWLKSLAVHTAAALLLLQVAALLSRPDREPYRSFSLSHRLQGKRRFLLFAITFGPYVIAIPVVWGLHHGLFDPSFSLSLLLVLMLCVQTWVFWADNKTLERGELKLRASEHRSSRILQSIGDAVIVTDANANVDRMNPIAEALTGWSIDAAKGLALTEIFHIFSEQTGQAVENPVDKVRRLGIIFGPANHTVLIGRSGQQTHIDESSAPIWGEGGELAGVVLVFRNINERRKSERLLRTSDERLKIALETVQLGLWELDLVTSVLTCSPTCKASFGRLPEQSLTRAEFVESIHHEDRAMAQEAVQRAIHTQGVYREEFRITWPDGSLHWILASGRVLLQEDSASATMVGVTLDVTERHQAAAALIQSEKLAVVGRLASSIAHEINNPLESLTNLLYLMRESTNPAEVKGYIAIAERELRRASGITSQTLGFHKQSSLPTPKLFEDLVEAVLSIYQGKLLNAKVHVEIRKRVATPIRCFEGEIRQVLSNLVGNAIDAMQPQGGTLTIRSSSSERGDGTRGMRMTIADNGVGINAETMKRIFEPFFTTKGHVGTGLGLWISQEIVHRHGGYLRARSSQQEDHRGTVFVVFLPFEAVERTSYL